MSNVIWDALRIRAENRARQSALDEANRAQAAASLRIENDYWLQVLREQPARCDEAMDELDRIRIIGKAS